MSPVSGWLKPLIIRVEGIKAVAEVYGTDSKQSSVPVEIRSMLRDLAARLDEALDAPAEGARVNGVGDENPFAAA